MTTVLSYQDRYASYRLSIENRIVCAVVSGAVGNSFAARYNKDFYLLIDQLEPGPWGHFGDFKNLEALTAEAQETSNLLHKEASKRGCVISAFRMNSALLTNQVNMIRNNSDLPTLENQQFFETKQQAIAFIEDFIANAINTEKTC